MTLTRSRPAPYHHLIAMLAASPDGAAARKLLTPESFAKLQCLAHHTRSWGFASAGGVVACAGLLPIGADADNRMRFEAWFACWPQLAPHMRSFVRLAQLTLDELPHDAIVEARVAPGWTPGEKLARLLGFSRGDAPDLWERRRK